MRLPFLSNYFRINTFVKKPVVIPLPLGSGIGRHQSAPSVCAFHVYRVINYNLFLKTYEVLSYDKLIICIRRYIVMHANVEEPSYVKGTFRYVTFVR